MQDHDMQENLERKWKSMLGSICTAGVTVTVTVTVTGICGSKSPRCNEKDILFHFRNGGGKIIRAWMWFGPNSGGGVEAWKLYFEHAGYPRRCRNQTVVGAMTDSNWVLGFVRPTKYPLDAIRYR